MLILGPVTQQDSARKEEERENLLEILGLYVGVSLGLMLWNHRREKKQIEAWQKSTLPGLVANYQISTEMIKERADKLQAMSQLKIYKAYYGQRT